MLTNALCNAEFQDDILTLPTGIFFPVDDSSRCRTSVLLNRSVYQDLIQLFEDAINDNRTGFIISGPPGTGKVSFVSVAVVCFINFDCFPCRVGLVCMCYGTF